MSKPGHLSGKRLRCRWARTYKARIHQGYEHCRTCGVVTTQLTFGHIQARVNGGNATSHNITIQCKPCQKRTGSSNLDMPGLANEYDYYDIVGVDDYGNSLHCEY